MNKTDYDLINLGTCIKGQADRLGIEHGGVPLEGVVVRIANAALASRAAAPLEPNWEYAWEADEEKRAQMKPRGPRLLIDGQPHYPEEIARFPKGRRVRRRKAGPWEPVGGDDE